MKLLIAFGTRPEYIKLKPIIEKLYNEKTGIDFKILMIGQHTDLLEDCIDIDMACDYIKLDEGYLSNRLDSIISQVLNKIDECNIFNGISHLLIQGDTSAALAMGLAGFNRKVEVVHLEAGLRSYDNDNPYPEEFNRKAISALSSIHLCPTENAANNLLSEHIGIFDIHVIGNTGLDNLKNIPVTTSNEVLVTLHRRENEQIITHWAENIIECAEKFPDLEFTIPIHPNGCGQKMKAWFDGFMHEAEVCGEKGDYNINLVDPLNHDKCIELIASCNFVITDSGGIVEESSFFGKRSIVCRKNTERVEGLTTHSTLCLKPSDLSRKVKMERDYGSIASPCPYGDGNSAERVIAILKEL